MRIRKHSMARTAAGAGALIVAGVIFGSAAMAGIADRERDPIADDQAQQFTTQNGTMRLELPSGWSVTDDGSAQPNHESELRWQNVLTLTAPDGKGLFYYDGSGSDTGMPVLDWGYVDAVGGPGGLAAVSWWQQNDRGYAADVMLTEPARNLPGDPPAGVVAHEGIERNHVMRLSADTGGAPLPQFGSAEEAQAWLSGPAAQQALAVISSVELLPVPGDAMP